MVIQVTYLRYDWNQFVECSWLIRRSPGNYPRSKTEWLDPKLRLLHRNGRPQNALRESPMTTSNVQRLIALASLISVLAAASALAQGQPSPSGAGDTDETVRLSPFVITSTTDHGYEAMSTLSGTRINTDLKDLAASISAVTKNMLSDLSVNNSEQLLYTLGTEVSGPYGNYSGTTFGTSYDFDAIDRSLLPQVRVRGLATADNTRNLFLTSIPWDAFDVDRVEIERGPNAMLYGSGSPAGIINETTIQPNLQRDRTELTFEYGSFGSSREQLDTNLVLVPDKLAIRIALKDSDDHFMQEEAFIKDKRIFAAATYQPFKYTALRANVEYGSQESVKPEWRPPYDNGVTYWYALGQPAYNPLTGNVTLGGTPTVPISAMNSTGGANSNVIQGNATSWGNAPAFYFSEPNQYAINIYGLSGINAVTNSGPNGQSFGALVTSAGYEQYLHAGQVGGGAWEPQEISNPAIFDFFDHMLEGPNKPEGARWNVYNLSLEQRLPDNSGGIELAYQRENVLSSFNNPLNWATYGISIDINTVLLNGQPNPNFGRPYDASDSWDTATNETRQAWRATAFYTFDSKKYLPEWLGRIVGTHTFTGNYSDSSDFSDTEGGRALETGSDWYSINPSVASQPKLIPSGGPRAYSTVVYLGNAGSSPTSMNIQPVTINLEPPSVIGAGTVPVTFYNTTTQQWQTSNVSVLSGSEFNKSAVNIDWTGGDTKSDLVSHVLILHSDMLDDAFVPTLGYRTDDYTSWNAPQDLVTNDGYSEVKAPLPPSPSSTEQHHSFNWGGVIRVPHFLEGKMPFGLQPGIFYNKADNFQPTAQRFDIFGAPIAPQQGQTKEYGFMLYTLDGKVSLRVTHFDTALTGSSLDLRDAIHSVVRDGIGGAWQNIINGQNAGNAAAVQAFESWWQTSPLAANISNTFDYSFTKDSSGNLTSFSQESRDGQVLQTQDTESKGNEVELTYNPTPQWRIGANLAKEQVITTNTARDALMFMNEIQPILQSPAGQVWVNAGHETWQQSAQDFINTVTSAAYQDGEPANPELRDWRFNVLANYTFARGFLKNVGVGGGLRWQSKILIGTGYMSGPNGAIPDYSREYWGPPETDVDCWLSYNLPKLIHGVDWKLQLNISNIGVGKELVPAKADPDGTVAEWRIRDPMTWTLRSDFIF